MIHKEKLRRYQRKYYNRERARKIYEVKIVHIKGTPLIGSIPLPEARVVKIERKGMITLRFMRKSLFSYSVVPSYTPNKNQSLFVFGGNYEKKTKIDEDLFFNQWDMELDGTLIDNFRARPTSLNEGYLYLIQAGDKNKMLEFQIKGGGNLHPIYWSNNDLREPEKESTRNIQVEQDTRFHIAYSRTQWSVEKTENLIETTTGRGELPTIFCDGNNGQKTDIDHFPYNEIVGEFLTADQKEYGKYLERELEPIATDEANPNPNKLKEDRFLILDDPIGCVLDVQKELYDQTNMLKATVESIKRGGTYRHIKWSIDNDEPIADPTDLEKEISNMVLLAQSIYQMVFFNKNMDKYAKLLSKKKIERILGVKRRNKLISELTKTRLGFYKLTKKRKVEEELSLLNWWSIHQLADVLWVRNLALTTFLDSDPYFIDSSLGMRLDNKGKNRNRIGSKPSELGFKQLDNDKSFSGYYTDRTTMPTKKFNSSLETDADLTKKIYGLAEAYAATSALIVDRIPVSHVFVFDDTINSLASRLNEIGFKDGTGEFTFRKMKPSELLTHIETKGAPVRISASSVNPTAVIETKNKNLRSVTVIDWEAQAPLTSKSHRFLNSPAFKRLGVLLNMVNIGFASSKAINDTNWKSYANLGTAVGDISGSFFELLATRNVMGKELSEKIGKSIGVVGAVAGFGLALHDSFESYEKDDKDTAALQLGAAVAMGFGAIAGGFSTTLLLGPVAWMAVGFVLGVLAIFTSDTELETFFKQIAFSKKHEYEKKKNLKPGAYNYQFFILSRFHDSSSENKWTDFEKALVDFTDMIIIPKIELRIVDVANKTSKTQKTANTDFRIGGFIGETTTQTTSRVSECKLTLEVRQFLSSKNQLDENIHAYLFKDGLGKSKELIETTFHTTFTKASENDLPKVDVRFSIPPEIIAQYKNGSRIVVLCRLRLDKNKFYPYQLKKKVRYIGISCGGLIQRDIRAGTTGSYSIGSLLLQKKVRVDTKEQLRSLKKW